MALDATVVDSSDSDAEEGVLGIGSTDKIIPKEKNQKRMESYSTTVWLSLWLAFKTSYL